MSAIIQSDFTIMLETSEPLFDKIKSDIIKFSEVVQAHETILIFKITSLSVWNAIAQKVSRSFIFQKLNEYSKFPLPSNILTQIDKWIDLYGAVELDSYSDSHLLLKVPNKTIKEKILKIKKIDNFLDEEVSKGFLIRKTFRGEIKSILIRYDLPVHDLIGFTEGDPLKMTMRTYIKGTKIEIENRSYQVEGSDAVFDANNGCVILPCGSGKTLVGLLFMIKCQTTTLIVTNSEASVKQWKKTLLNFTDLTEKDVGTYDKKNKEIKKVTIVTYNMLSYKYKGEFIHFNKFLDCNWGCLILDEVHLMPANMFRIVGALQSLKRLALTATFVREDGREIDVFSLIGPKRYEKSWKELEALGYIAGVNLQEIKVNMSEGGRKRYAAAKTVQEKFEIAATDINKAYVLRDIARKHKGATILVIGHFTKNLIELGKRFKIPVVYGDTPHHVREMYYEEMRNKKRKLLFASKIANAALDIPIIGVVVQISFQYGSRNEEAQRVGRATRPKDEQAYFYTIICKNTKEEDYNFNRKRFLSNEGYVYETREVAV